MSTDDQLKSFHGYYRLHGVLAMTVLSLVIVGLPLNSPAQDTNPVVRPYYNRYISIVDKEQDPSFSPTSPDVFYQPDGTFSFHFQHDDSVWYRDTNQTSRLISTTTNRAMNNLQMYQTLYNDGYFDETYDEYMAMQPWHLVGNVTTNSPYVPPDSAWWNKMDFSYMYLGLRKFEEETRIELLTSGSTNAAMVRPYILGVGAYDYPQIVEDQGMNSENAVPVPESAIAVWGAHPKNGIIITNFPDNNILEVTPQLLTNYTNYAFNVGVQRVKVNIVAAFGGQITPLTTNITGGVTNIYGPSYYPVLTNWWENGRTTLGAGGPTYSPGMHFGNLTEFRAQVPDFPEFQSGWQWCRDVHGKRFLWDPVTNIVTVLSGTKTNTVGAPPSAGNDYPTANNSNSYSDTLPDAGLMIFDHDAPSIRSATFAADTVIGTVIALRFNARQWLTWNGAFASDVIYWSGSVTIKKVGLGPYDWVMVSSSAPNASGHLSEEELGFTAEEAASY